MLTEECGGQFKLQFKKFPYQMVGWKIHFPLKFTFPAQKFIQRQLNYCNCWKISCQIYDKIFYCFFFKLLSFCSHLIFRQYEQEITFNIVRFWCRKHYGIKFVSVSEFFFLEASLESLKFLFYTEFQAAEVR